MKIQKSLDLYLTLPERISRSGLRAKQLQNPLGCVMYV